MKMKLTIFLALGLSILIGLAVPAAVESVVGAFPSKSTLAEAQRVVQLTDDPARKIFDAVIGAANLQYEKLAKIAQANFDAAIGAAETERQKTVIAARGKYEIATAEAWRIYNEAVKKK